MCINMWYPIIFEICYKEIHQKKFVLIFCIIKIEETDTITSSDAAVSSFYVFISIMFINLMYVRAWVIVAHLYNIILVCT